MLEWGGWGWSVCNGREEMAKARLQLLLLHFISLSQRSIHMDQNHDRTLLSNFGFCWRKKHLKIPFLVLDLKVQQAKKTPACYCMSPGCRNGQSGSSSSSLGLYDKKQLYMQEPVLTLSLKCATRHVWGHISYGLWRLIWPHCNNSAPTGSTVLYLSSSV